MPFGMIWDRRTMLSVSMPAASHPVALQGCQQPGCTKPEKSYVLFKVCVSPRFQNQRKSKVLQGSQQPEAPKSGVGLECGVIYKQFELVLNWF